MSRRIYLHVGIAKTGTTYLQRRLFANREALSRRGTLYPGATRTAHFFGSLDLRGATFKGHEYDGVAGAWDRLVAAADAFDGTTVISHETLARAKVSHIERAVGAFATDDVRVVVTARDLFRQIPATWQETLKNRGEMAYADYVSEIMTGWAAGNPPRTGFWGAQDLAGLVQRWGRVVGMERVTVVTVPPSGADRGELWRRFSRATELPDIDYVDPQDTGNASLGVAEAELLRRLNPLLTAQLDWPAYDALVKRRLAEVVLAPTASAGRLSVPPEWTATVHEIAAAQVEAVQGSGVAVVGDLEDLAPALATPDLDRRRQPADLSDAELLAAALRGLAGMTAAAPLPNPEAPPRTSPLVAAPRRVVGLIRRARGWRPFR